MTDENNQNNKKSRDGTKIFTLTTDDSNSEEMPSVSRLLNRKSLNLGAAVKEKANKTNPVQAPTSSPPSHVELSPALSAPPPVEAPPPPPEASHPLTIKTVARKPPPPAQTLNIWELEQMKKGSDPLGKGIARLMEKGATSTLFLSIFPPPPGFKIPQFTATATSRPEQLLTLWTGLRWDPNKSPEIWDVLSKAGTIEFSPPGTYTQLESQRNVIRSALGVQAEEWLLLVRVGTTAACRGIVIFLSKKSLLLEVKSVLSLLQQGLK